MTSSSKENAAMQKSTPLLKEPSSDSSSPHRSVERLSLPRGAEAQWSSELSLNMAGADNGRDDTTPSPAGRSSGMRLSVTGLGGTDEDDDYSASVAAIIHRRASTTKKPSGFGKRRTSSPLDSDRRRSSIFTTSSADTAITVDGQEGITQEQIFENIRLHKEVLESVKQQPWEMRRKIKLVQQAKEYIRRHEGHLQERLAQSKSTKDVMASFTFILSRWWQWIKREFGNLAVNLIPWELRIKEIESHFGSVVASYFTFLRWVFWINIVMTAIIVCLIIVPEIIAADKSKAGTRKEIQSYDKETAYDLSTLWNFEGAMKYSPMFYGYYTDVQPKPGEEGYNLPLSYFLTGLGIYVYSFVAILRRMAKNARQSKLSEKEDECIFSWKVFTGWDFMIGNPETAFNRFASITMGFKEALLEEKEKKKDERNWKVVSLRVFANFLVLMLLGTSAWAVVKVVERSEETEKMPDSSWWRQNEITLVMSLITTIFPNLFELVGILEKYHPRRQLRWQLGRIMVLNFLNLYTLMFALFGKVGSMNETLQSLRPTNATTTTALPPMPILPPCFNVSVNCNLYDEFQYNDTLKETSEVLTFIINTVLMTKYEPNGSFSQNVPKSDSKYIQKLHTEFNQSDLNHKELWGMRELLNTIIPNLGRGSSPPAPDLIQFQAEISDIENLTLFTPPPGFGVNDTFNMIPQNSTTLKVALPLLMKLVMALVPQRPFPPQATTPQTPLSAAESTTVSPTESTTLTPTASSTPSSTTSEYATETDLMTLTSTSGTILMSSTSETNLTGVMTSNTETESQTPVTTPSPTSSSTASTRLTVPRWQRMFNRGNNWQNRNKSVTRNTLWRTPRAVALTITDVTDSTDGPDTEGTEVMDDANLILGRNGHQTSLRMSTRGDIPGDVSASEPDPTTPIPASSTTRTIPTDVDKLLTKIITTIKFIANHSSLRADFPNLTTIDEFAKFETNYHSFAETKLARYPFNSSFTSSYQRDSKQNEISKCYIVACENGTIEPSNLLHVLNCSDLSCAMDKLDGKINDSSALCILTGRGCPTTTEKPTVSPTPTPYPTVQATTVDPDKLGKLCWETMFGQELVKLTVMDLIFTVAVILVLDFIRAILVRIMNPCWCWNLEKKFPQYGDFKIAENILHLVNNQGMIWMGLFFSPGLPAINLVKLVVLMYIRSWTVMTCNVPHETVFRASRSNNFYFALLLFMLFLCVLPVGYAISQLKPSWHCGPFSTEKKIYDIFTTALFRVLHPSTHDAVKYIASPGIIIPLLVLLVLVIYYLLSLTSSLREANNDLKIQLRRERTEERRKMFKIAGGKMEKETALSRWQAIIPIPTKSSVPRVSILTSGKQTGFAGLAKRATLKARELSQSISQEKSKSQEEAVDFEADDGSGTDVDISQVSLPEDVVGQSGPSSAAMRKSAKRKPSTTESVASRTSEIPVIKISKDEEVGGASATAQKKPDTSATAGQSSHGPLTPRPVVDPAKRERITKALISRAKTGSTVSGPGSSHAACPMNLNLVTDSPISKGRVEMKTLQETPRDTPKVEAPALKFECPAAKYESHAPIFDISTARLESPTLKFESPATPTPTSCGSPIGSLLNQDHLLDMDEIGMDIHPFFVQFQTGFESSENGSS